MSCSKYNKYDSSLYNTSKIKPTEQDLKRGGATNIVVQLVPKTGFLKANESAGRVTVDPFSSTVIDGAINPP